VTIGLALLLLGARPPAATADKVPSPPSAPSASASPGGEPWKPYKSKRGIAVERRPVAGSKFFEYRATGDSTLPPAQVMAKMWKQVTESLTPVVKKREVLRRSDNEVVIYDQVATPVVSDRDYTLRIQKSGNSDGSRFEMRFETANELGPAVQPKFVRIPAIRGSWTIEATPSGGSKLTYITYSEPGGAVPAFLIHGAQFDNTIDNVLRAQENLAKPTP
jgi:hypothetical protein